MPKLTHPDAKDPIEVRDDQVPAYLGQGWRRVKSLPRKVAERQVKTERADASNA